jgi:prolipoprotein diacylglyceryltransferase
MLMYPHIDPVAVRIGPLAVHWYGLTYLVAFALFWLLAQVRLRHEPYRSITGPGAWSRRDVEDILFLGVVGVVLGGPVSLVCTMGIMALMMGKEAAMSLIAMLPALILATAANIVLGVILYKPLAKVWNKSK